LKRKGKAKQNIGRDEDEKKILLDLALKKNEEKEKDDFILTGYRKRKVRIISFSLLLLQS
jgi:hypothetical protein